MVEARENAIADADQSQGSFISGAQRELDADGFFLLSDEEIDQIMACCKPLPNDITVQIDPASYCGTTDEAQGANQQPGSNPASEESKNASMNSASSAAFDQHFVCGICQMVVLEAEECGKCQNCFCARCIKQWQQLSTNYKLADPPSQNVVSAYGERNLVVVCPMCKEGYTGTPLHRYLKNKLSTFLFKCVNCGEQQPLPYEKMVEH